MNIKITCKGCGSVHIVNRTEELKQNVHSLGCNFCPSCEDNATEEYKEWPYYKKKEPTKNKPVKQGDLFGKK